MVPTVIKYTAGTSITLNVTHVDNILVGYLEETTINRRQIYGRMTDNDPTLKDSIDISAGTRTANDVLVLTGTNLKGGGRIAFTIVVGTTVAATVSVNLDEYVSQTWAYLLQRV